MMMKKNTLCGLVALVVLLALGFPVKVSGQAVGNARIFGNVSDPSGAAIAGASVKVSNEGTGAVRTVQSGSDGVYVASDLHIGTYNVEVTMSGFKLFKATGIVLHINDDVRRDVQMEVGTVASSVQVQGRSTMVDTYSSALAQT